MRNKLNIIVLFISLFFLPFFTEGKSTEEKSFIQEIKEKITSEKEKQGNQTKEEIKTDKKENKTVSIVKKIGKKAENNHADTDKNNYNDYPEKRSRIQIVKDNIAEETKRQEIKKKEKKKGEKHNKDYYYDGRRDHYYYNNRRYDHRPFYIRRHRSFYDAFPGYFINVRYSNYPYAGDTDYNFSGLSYSENPPEKIAFLYSSAEASYLGKDVRDTYGATAKISGNIYSLNFNYFYHRIFSSEESISFYSLNGGIYFALADFTLTPFIGAFYVETVDEIRFSYGANLQVFFPGNYILDLYNINSSYGSLNFNHISASLNYALYRFNIGLGFNYNNYAGVSFSGPLVKLSFWL